jgi:hypothetical protein
LTSDGAGKNTTLAIGVNSAPVDAKGDQKDSDVPKSPLNNRQSAPSVGNQYSATFKLGAADSGIGEFFYNQRGGRNWEHRHGNKNANNFGGGYPAPFAPFEDGTGHSTRNGGRTAKPGGSCIR